MRTRILTIALISFLSHTLTAGQRVEIYVSKTGWHTNIIIPANSLPDSIFQADHTFPKARYFEIGWGDRDFYPNPEFNLWQTIKAVFWPTPSTLHVNPIQGKSHHYFVVDRLVRISLEQPAFNALLEYLLKEFSFDARGKMIPIHEGLYGDSWFFAGTSSYYFPRNSNVWTAQLLKAGGLGIGPYWCQTADITINKAARFGEELR